MKILTVIDQFDSANISNSILQIEAMFREAINDEKKNSI